MTNTIDSKALRRAIQAIRTSPAFDLGKPPMSQTTKTFTATGSHGVLTCDADTGNVLAYDPDCDASYGNITRLDVAEWHETYPDGDLYAGHDILDFGSWDTEGVYVGPESDWRFNLWQDRAGDAMWRIKLGPKARDAYGEWLMNQPEIQSKPQDSESYTANSYKRAREVFANRKSNAAAANYLRAALNADAFDLIDDEEMAGVLFDVIDYLER